MSITIIALAILLVAYSMSTGLKPALTPSPTPEATPSHTPYPYIKEPPVYFTELSQYEVNVTQGESFQINLTITYLLNETKTFTPHVQLAGYGNAAWDLSKDSHKVFNATFGQEQVVLEPNVKVPNILTINIAQDAPLGRYLFYVTNVGLDVNVSPKQNYP